MKTVVLIDDVRSFADGRECRIARSSAAGIDLLAELSGEDIDELWLDHDLGFDDTIMPVVEWLVARAQDGVPARVRKILIHSSNAGAAFRMGERLSAAGYHVERSYNLAMWVRGA